MRKRMLAGALAICAATSTAGAQTLEIASTFTVDPSLPDGLQFGTLLVAESDRAFVGGWSELRAVARQGDAWPPTATLLPSDQGDHRFSSMSVSGDTLVLGTSAVNTDMVARSGAARVVRFDGIDFTDEAEISASDPSAGQVFGKAVAIDGDVIVVGAPGGGFSDDLGPGLAYVFRRTGTSWVEEARLTSGETGYDGFGTSVDVKGDRLVVGAGSYDLTDYTGANAAFVFERQGGMWVQTARVEPELPPADLEQSRFGLRVDLSGERMAVSGLTSAYLFVLHGLAWTQTEAFQAEPGQIFLRSIALDGDRMAVLLGENPEPIASLFALSSDGKATQALDIPSGSHDTVALRGDMVLLGPVTADPDGKVTGYLLEESAAGPSGASASASSGAAAAGGDAADAGNEASSGCSCEVLGPAAPRSNVGLLLAVGAILLTCRRGSGRARARLRRPEISEKEA